MKIRDFVFAAGLSATLFANASSKEVPKLPSYGVSNIENTQNSLKGVLQEKTENKVNYKTYINLIVMFFILYKFFNDIRLGKKEEERIEFEEQCNKYLEEFNKDYSGLLEMYEIFNEDEEKFKRTFNDIHKIICDFINTHYEFIDDKNLVNLKLYKNKSTKNGEIGDILSNFVGFLDYYLNKGNNYNDYTMRKFTRYLGGKLKEIESLKSDLKKTDGKEFIDRIDNILLDDFYRLIMDIHQELSELGITQIIINDINSQD